MNKGIIPQNFIANDTQTDEDELPIEKPTRSSKRPFKQISTYYDDIVPAKKIKNIGRKVFENVETENKDFMNFKLEQKVECPMDENRMIYKSIWISENDENDFSTKCDICMGDDDDEGDEMVLCDGCNVCTHQTCYGRDILNTLPKGNEWFCQRC